MYYIDFVKSQNVNDNVYLKAKELFEGFSDSQKLIIPEISSITIKGLYPYKSDHEIELKNDKANIIYGGNGAGKTTTINSIEFGLLGSSSDFEIKSNFSNRVLNKYEVDCILKIANESYLLKRSLTPQAESHQAMMQKVSESEFTSEYEKYEGVRDVNTYFQSLTGINISEFAKIFDFFSVRVPRRHYLSSSIHNTPGSMYRQKIISKLLGHHQLVKLADESYRRWNQSKSAINQTKRKIEYLEPLQKTEVHQVSDSDLHTDITNELNTITLKISELQKQKEELFEKQIEIQEKEPVYEFQEERISQQIKLEKLEQIQQNEWICDMCNSDFSSLAQIRLKEGSCPSCGHSDIVLDLNEYNEIRERIHQLNLKYQKYNQRLEKFKLIQNKLVKEAHSIDREISILTSKKEKLIRETTVISSGQSNDFIYQLEEDLKNYEEEETLYNSIYSLTKEFIEQTVEKFLNLLNQKFSYYQRELFDLSKWGIGPNFEVIADDGQEFKHMSHGEKNITDILFRMAVFDSIIEEVEDTNLFLVVDTPEEGLDAAFHKRFQPVLFDFVKEHKQKNLIVLTSCERDFVDSLEPKNFRLENLLIKSSNSRPFQVTQLKLMQFLG